MIGTGSVSSTELEDLFLIRQKLGYNTFIHCHEQTETVFPQL